MRHSLRLLAAALAAGGMLTLATPAHADGPSLLAKICEFKGVGYGDGPGFYCDSNDIAVLLSGLVDPVFNITCLNHDTKTVICRVDKDRAPR
jgi:hypothetical protein